MRRFLSAALLISSVWGLAAAPKPPKLVVAIVIDQFRYDYLWRFQKDYNAGLSRLLEHGAVFTDAHHIHFPTVTAIGHSTVLSGATPSTSGIVGNEWFDRETGKIVTSVSDSDEKLLGGTPGELGSSPRRLLVSTIGDELKMQGRDSKVIGISIKDRGAILTAGHAADGAYWFDNNSNQWVTSSYYMTEPPAWVTALNKQRPSAASVGQQWLPFDAKEGSAKPFCTMVTGDEKVPVCKSLEATPWGNEMIEAFAERALVEEKLGHHADTDVLTVSFSSNDYVGHAFGPDSPEVRDISIRTDRLLGKLLDFVDQQVGPGNAVVVLTADHGVAPLAEVNQARRMVGGRLSAADLKAKVNDALTAKYGTGKWLAASLGTDFYLNRELIASKNLDSAEVERTAAAALLDMPHIYRVYTRHQLLSGEVQSDWVSRAVINGFYSQRSADIVAIAEPYYVFYPTGASHSTPFNYDNQVPVIFMGPGIKPGTYQAHVAVNDIAPTLASMLGLVEPTASVGRVLTEMLEK